jgi:hypothetical protein
MISPRVAFWFQNPGPTITPMFDNVMGSALGAFEKVRASKVRIIHDLSWPPSQSINEQIPNEDFFMKFLKFDENVQQLQN